MSTLYELSTDYITILDQICDDGGEISQSDIQAWKQLDELHDNMQDKAINVASYIKNLEAEFEQVSKARKNMVEREKGLQKRIDWLSSYLKLNLQKCGIEKITRSPHFVIQLKKCPHSVNIIDEALIPIDYKTIKEILTIDKLKIKDALKNGMEVSGVELIQNMKLDIK
jgi:hypothetical protein